MLYIQYGCGTSAPVSWANFDCSPRLRLERFPVSGALVRLIGSTLFPEAVRFGDIVKGLPIAENSCKGIYCSHVLEHLALEDCRTALRNTCKYLEPGGIFRLVLPDLGPLIAAAYLNSDPKATLNLITLAGGRITRPKGPISILRDALGNSRHLWGWDYCSLAFELKAAGFHRVRRAQLGDSSDPRFLEVEDAERWEGSLGIECIK